MPVPAAATSIAEDSKADPDGVLADALADEFLASLGDLEGSSDVAMVTQKLMQALGVNPDSVASATPAATGSPTATATATASATSPTRAAPAPASARTAPAPPSTAADETDLAANMATMLQRLAEVAEGRDDVKGKGAKKGGNVADAEAEALLQSLLGGLNLDGGADDLLQQLGAMGAAEGDSQDLGSGEDEEDYSGSDDDDGDEGA